MPNFNLIPERRREKARERNKAYQREWKKRNPDKVAEYSRKQRTPEQRERRNALARARVLENPEKELERNRRRRERERAAFHNRKGKRKRILSEETRRKNRERCRVWWAVNRDRCNDTRRGMPRPSRAAPSRYPAMGELHKKALLANEIYVAAAKALPRGLDSSMRDDVISEIVLAVVEGTVSVADIPKKAWAMAQACCRKYNPRGFVSLDVLVRGTDCPWLDSVTYDDAAWGCSQEEEAFVGD